MGVGEILLRLPEAGAEAAGAGTLNRLAGEALRHRGWAGSAEDLWIVFKCI